jgi:hypothetical protein
MPTDFKLYLHSFKKNSMCWSYGLHIRPVSKNFAVYIWLQFFCFLKSFLFFDYSIFLKQAKNYW